MKSEKMRHRLSVVVMTKNEEDKIARCLESVKWADEIIVVDDMSTDKTTQICQSLGAKVIRNRSCGNFDHQRNLGIDSATGDWILQMDADEFVNNRLKEKIIYAINNPSQYVAFKFRRKNFFLGHFMRYAGEYNYYTKLFRKDKASYVGRSVHETLNVDGEVGIIDGDIEHYVFETVGQFVDRQNFYSSVEAKALLNEKGILPERILSYNLTLSPLKLFWKLYIRKKGYKDGMYGLIWCFLQSFRRILIWAKYWELIKAR